MYSSLFRISCLLFGTVAALQTTKEQPVDAHGNASLARKRDRKLMFIGVNSAAGDVTQRHRIRNCWMKHNLLHTDDPPVVAKFVVAKPDEGSPEKEALDKDMAAHPDDFLVVDAPEGYRNLTKKTIAYYRWAAEDQNYEFYMKVDDEMFPSIGFMHDRFREDLDGGIRYTYAGELFIGRWPWTTGKYAQDPAKWDPATQYPEFAPGDGYVLSADLAKVVFKDNYEANMKLVLDNEDVNTGLWIENAFKNGVKVNYQSLPERCDWTCIPIGRDSDRCCIADGPDTFDQE